jgi:hypothetical protein
MATMTAGFYCYWKTVTIMKKQRMLKKTQLFCLLTRNVPLMLLIFLVAVPLCLQLRAVANTDQCCILAMLSYPLYGIKSTGSCQMR